MIVSNEPKESEGYTFCTNDKDEISFVCGCLQLPNLRTTDDSVFFAFPIACVGKSFRNLLLIYVNHLNIVYPLNAIQLERPYAVEFRCVTIPFHFLSFDSHSPQ